MDKPMNRIREVLEEQGIKQTWLAEQFEKDPATVSKWCTNTHNHVLKHY